jgi:isoleucyl-tRNA synthetase
LRTDYKDTLNLPQTGFPMKADLIAREPQRLQKWQAAGLWHAIQAARAGAPKFVLHDGPPFANGDVHIGTALNKILKDIIVKYQTLRGKDAPYVPGWDCHGLPIEFKVTQEMRKGSAGSPPAAAGEACEADASARRPYLDFSPAAIRQACEAYARKFIDLQRAQFKRLGVLGDWENPYLTLNKQYEADELRLFADIVEKGFVYRGKKPVYWSIPARTALAEAEVEYHDHTSQSIYVKFPVAGQPGTFILIWTTTPWTLPANLAVAFNSTLNYSLVRVGEEEYWILSALVPSIAEKCQWQNYQTVRSVLGGELAALEYRHPFCARTGRLYAGDAFVESATGTGFVHIAPGHGMEDYQLGRQNGLPIYSPIDDDGCFAFTGDLPLEQQMPPEMIGKSTLEKHGKSDANAAVLHELRARHALLHEEDYQHSYPFCWRSKTPVIYRAMDQWFIRIDHPLAVAADDFPPQRDQRLSAESRYIPTGVAADGNPPQTSAGLPMSFRAAALAEIDRVKWIPAWGVNRIKAAVESRPDWCISRQRSWGVPIPAFYDAKGEPILDARIVRAAADLIEQHGSNVWFEKSAAELWAIVKPKDWPGPEAASKSSDTLDVWIDSGSSSRAVLMRRKELRHAEVSNPQSAIRNPLSWTVPGGTPATAGGTPALPNPQSAIRNPQSAIKDPQSAMDWQADVYLEGSDQHRGWFQSSLLLSLAGNGAAPFKTVLTHGFMVDADREKISKSKQGQGGYEKPQTAEAYVKKYGADVVRLWVASQDFRNDIVVSEERVNKVGETYRAIRNALRYQLSNLYDFDPAKHSVADDKLTGLDRWILAEFSKLEAEVIAAYDQYEFHVVYQKLSQFIAVELSSIYHDVIKDRLYTDAANSPRRRSTQTALHRLVTGLCKMLSPILVFTADEAWEFVPGKKSNSVHEATWQPVSIDVPPSERTIWENLFEVRRVTLPELERLRQTKVIGKSLEARLFLVGDRKALGESPHYEDSLRELLNVSKIRLNVEPEKPLEDVSLDRLNLRLKNKFFGELEIKVAKAEGRKCERCWHWETDVGSNPDYPTICGRCIEAVKLHDSPAVS